MNIEGIGRRVSKRDLNIDLNDRLAEVDNKPLGNLSKTDRVHLKNEGLLRESSLYNLDQVEEMLKRQAKTLSKFGFKDVLLIPSSAFSGFDQTAYAVQFEGKNKEGELEKGWVVMEFNNENSGSVEYRCNWGNNSQILEVVKTPPGFEFEDLQNISESTKVVKSRPMWMYPELFGLPNQEVWPKNSDIAVIGDPYQACDHDRTTIIEYEYSDEMLPPILYSSLKDSGKDTRSNTLHWVRDLYREDIQALSNIYGTYSPASGNVYREFSDVCTDFLGECAEKISRGEKFSEGEYEKMEKLKSVLKDLCTGSWGYEEGKKIILESNKINGLNSVEIDKKTEEDLKLWMEYKQEHFDGLNNPKNWQEFTTRWGKYLLAIPKEYLKKQIPDLEKKLTQAKHWLETIPSATSPERVNNGLMYLSQLYSEFEMLYDENIEESKSLFDSNIRFIESRGMMADHVLGYCTPGYPLNKRNRNTLKELVDRVQQLFVYNKTIWPELQKELKQIDDAGVSMTDDTKYHYLRSFEKAFSQQSFFYKRTQMSVPIHGFFPHNISGIDPQDRILALTSVTMHGWNNLDQEGFRRDLEPALKFLKIGGKYILGPINQHVYMGRSSSEFRSEELTDALKEMKNKGLIEYKFVKGKREDFGEFSQHGEVETDVAELWSKDDQILLDGESAHSLVITRIK